MTFGVDGLALWLGTGARPATADRPPVAAARACGIPLLAP